MVNATDLSIGIIYFTMGIFGMFENGLTAYLMATDREMRNPTYVFMINLSITDVIILLPIASYAGSAIIWPNLMHPIAVRIGAYLVAIGWYCGCLFMLLASFSRYVQLAKPEKVPEIFSRRNLIITITLSWLIPAIVYTCFLYYSPIIFNLLPDKYTWNFERGHSVGNAFSIFNISINSIFAFVINSCNLKSLLCVRNIRKQVQSIQSSGNQKREIKLFLQCAITGTIYTAAVIYYFVVTSVQDLLVWHEFLLTHVLWTSNHLQNPVIYFVLNTRLRRRVMKIFCAKWAKNNVTTLA